MVTSTWTFEKFKAAILEAGHVAIAEPNLKVSLHPGDDLSVRS